MIRVIIVDTAWHGDRVFIGEEGSLLSEPDSAQYGVVACSSNGNQYKICVDFNDYVPYSTLIKELF